MKIEKLTQQMGKVLFNKDQLHVVCSARRWRVFGLRWVNARTHRLHHCIYLRKHCKTFERTKLYKVFALKYVFHLAARRTTHRARYPKRINHLNACRFSVGNMFNRVLFSLSARLSFQLRRDPLYSVLKNGNLSAYNKRAKPQFYCAIQ